MIDIPALLVAHEVTQARTAKADFEAVLEFQLQELFVDGLDVHFKAMLQGPPATRQTLFGIVEGAGANLLKEDSFKADISNFVNVEWPYA